ncbi:MAG: hypothetical protein HYU75_03875 [Betaproteobacteria bacterium]|nr:hypothetical protein [Betaproteobacteria bacterium]
MPLVIGLALLAGAAGADTEADMRRALIERQQRSDELILRLRQSRPPPGNLRAQRELDALRLQQQQQLHLHNAQQLRQFDASRQSAPADPEAARALMQQQQQMFERDRQLELQQFRWEEERLLERER